MLPTYTLNLTHCLITLLHEQQLLILAHKIIHCPLSVPELFIDWLNANESVHTHNTRNKNNTVCICLELILVMDSNV